MEVLREFIQRNTLEEEEKEGETSEEKGAINKMFDSHKIDAKQKRILEYAKRSKDAVLTGLKLFELEVVWLESAIAVNWSAVLTPLY